MFVGWGKKIEQHAMPDGRLAVCIYRYYSLMFIFKLATNKKWYIVDGRVAAQPSGRPEMNQLLPPPPPPPPINQLDENQQILRQSFGVAAVQDTDRDELATYFLPEGAPNISAWERFGLIAAVAVLAVVIGILGWSQRGTTLAAAINRGDCFVNQVAAIEIDRLTTPSCEEAHDSQVIGLVELSDAPKVMPNDFDSYWDGIYDQCLTLADQRVFRVTAIPEDTTVGLFTPTPEGWGAGDRRSVCYFHSATGLVGSFVTEGSDD